MGSNLIRETANTIERYEAPRVLEPTGGFAGFAVPELAALSSDHNFIDSLEAVIASVASSSWRQALIDSVIEVGGRKLPRIPEFALPSRHRTRSATLGSIAVGRCREPSATRFPSHNSNEQMTLFCISQNERPSTEPIPKLILASAGRLQRRRSCASASC
jgi:hypothetical protein